MSYTPGPWGHESDEGDYVVMTLSPARLSHTVAEVYNADDARLIAAAPDLLAIVKEHLTDHLEACHITRRGDVCVLSRQTQEIIARAEGREP